MFRLIKGRDLLTVERPRGCICFATAWQRARVPISSATLSALAHCRPGYAPASSYSRVRQLAPQTRNLTCVSRSVSLFSVACTTVRKARPVFRSDPSTFVLSRGPHPWEIMRRILRALSVIYFLSLSCSLCLSVALSTPLVLSRLANLHKHN